MGSLADEYGTTVTILRKANPGSLYAGRKIVVPVTETTAGGSLAERLGLNYDLVFIADGDLGIWKADTGKLHVFREPFELLELDTDESGDWVLARATADGGLTHEILRINIPMRRYEILRSGMPPAEVHPDRKGVLLAGDGDRGAYLVWLGEEDNLYEIFQFSPEEHFDVGRADPSAELFEGPDDNSFYLARQSGITGYVYGGGLNGVPYRPPNSQDPELFGYDAVAWNKLPVSPNETGFYDTPGSAADVVLGDSYAYVADGSSGLRVIDVSDPANPREVGHYAMQGNAIAVAVAGNYAYIADFQVGLHVIDVSDPAAPREVGYYKGRGIAFDIAVDGNYAYIATLAIGPQSWGMHVIDVSDPTNPRRIGQFGEDDGFRGIAVAGSYAYTVTRNSLFIINVSEAAHPKAVSFLYFPSISSGVALAGSYAYFGDRMGVFHIIDVSDPANPREVGHYAMQGNAIVVAVAGNYAYIANRPGGLVVLDVADTSAPSQVGAVDTPGSASGVSLAGNYAYVADGSGGLRIFKVSEDVLLFEGDLFEGSAYHLYFSGSGEVNMLPGSSSYITTAASGWLQDDDSVRVITPPDDTGTVSPTYRDFNQNNGWDPVESGTLTLPAGTSRSEDLGYYIFSPGTVPDGESAIFSIQNTNGTANALWRMRPDGTAQRLNSLPAIPAPYRYWLPDNSGVLLHTPGFGDQPASVLYVPADGGTPFSLSDWLGVPLSDFHWVPRSSE